MGHSVAELAPSKTELIRSKSARRALGCITLKVSGTQHRPRNGLSLLCVRDEQLVRLIGVGHGGSLVHSLMTVAVA